MNDDSFIKVITNVFAIYKSHEGLKLDSSQSFVENDFRGFRKSITKMQIDCQMGV